MKKGSFRKFVAMSIFGVACTALNTGCTFLEDVAYGFALALGAVPAQFIVDAVIPPAE